MFSTIILGSIALLFLFFLACVFAGCATGRHDWYGGKNGTDSCGSRWLTGPLLGERVTHNGQGWRGYRRERQCRDCDKLEYRNYETEEWVDITKLAAVRKAKGYDYYKANPGAREAETFEY